MRGARLDKVQLMRDSGVEPFSYTFASTVNAAKLREAFEGKLEPGEEDSAYELSIAGRIMARRIFGKLAFFSLQDESGTIQLQFDKKVINQSNPESFKNLKAWTDSGDIIGVKGTVRRTDKGELTVNCAEWEVSECLVISDRNFCLTNSSL